MSPLRKAALATAAIAGVATIAAAIAAKTMKAGHRDYSSGNRIRFTRKRQQRK